MVFLHTKFPDPVTLRKMVQEGHRWTPQELLAERMIDEIVDGGSDAVLKQALAMADKRSGDAKTGVYGLIKVFSCFLGGIPVLHLVILPPENDVS